MPYRLNERRGSWLYGAVAPLPIQSAAHIGSLSSAASHGYCASWLTLQRRRRGVSLILRNRNHEFRAEIEIGANCYVVRLYNTEGKHDSMSAFTTAYEALRHIAGWICYDELTIEAKHPPEQR